MDIAQQAFNLYTQLPRYKKSKRGKLSLSKQTIPANEPITIINVRQSFMEGKKQTRATAPFPIDKWTLQEQGQGTWMSSSLMEIAQMIPAIEASQGHVLVGGLGMGIISHLLIFKPGVISVTTVEINSDLIKMIQPQISGMVKIVQGDIHEYLKNCKENFDFAFLDTWQLTGECTWIDDIVPLRRYAAKAGIKEVMCWQEKEMETQIKMGLINSSLLDEKTFADSKYLTPKWVFGKALRDSGIPAQLTWNKDVSADDMFAQMAAAQSNPKIQELIDLFATRVGTPEWEAMFGQYWDEHTQICKEKDNGRTND